MTGLTKLAIEYVHKGMKSHRAAQLAGITENELALHLEDEQILLNQIERDYMQNEKPKVDAAVHDFLAEFPSQEKRNIKMQLLLERMKTAKEEKDVSKVRDYTVEYHILMGINIGVKPDQILRASEFPISELVKTARNGMAHCPFHEDKTPSMDIRKNFYYCYSCGEHGNAINLVIKLDGYTFKQAVQKLST